MTFVPCFLWIFLGAPFIETPARQPRARRRARGDHRRGGRRDPQPRHLVRAARAVREVSEVRLLGMTLRRAGAGQPACRVAGPDRGRPARGVPLQDRHDSDPGRLCRARRRLPSARRLDLIATRWWNGVIGIEQSRDALRDGALGWTAAVSVARSRGRSLASGFGCPSWGCSWRRRGHPPRRRPGGT